MEKYADKLVYATDEETKEYSVLDPVTTQKVTISYDDLKKVRFSPGSYPLLGQMYWIKKVPEKLPDLRPLVLKSIHKTCWLMVSEPSWASITSRAVCVSGRRKESTMPA